MTLQEQIDAQRQRQWELEAPPPVDTSAYFFIDLCIMLTEAQFLRGRKNPFARIQFQEIGWWDEDTFSTDL